MIISYGTRQTVQLDSFYVTDSPLSVTKIAKPAKFCLYWPVLMIIPYGTLQIVQFDSFYVIDSPLSVTNIAELEKFYLNRLVLMIIPWGTGLLVQPVSLNKLLTVSRSQIVH